MRLKPLNIALLSLSLLMQAQANPQLEQKISGEVKIEGNGTPHMVVKQNSHKSILHWRQFDIGKNEHVHFDMPKDGLSLNRVKAKAPSKIAGRLSAQGTLFLVNPSGIAFLEGSRVDVGSLLATTANITNDDFLKGRYYFSMSPELDSKIINNGNITIADGGFAALVAPGVENHGIIQANLGSVTLGSVSQYTVDLAGDGLIHFAMNSPMQPRQSDTEAVINHTGTIIADGGRVHMHTQAVSGVVENVINTSGVVRANSVQQANGEIILNGGGAGQINVRGKLLAEGRGRAKAGTITVKNIAPAEHTANINFDDSATVSVAGESKLGGKATISTTNSLYMDGRYHLQGGGQLHMQAGQSVLHTFSPTVEFKGDADPQLHFSGKAGFYHLGYPSVTCAISRALNENINVTVSSAHGPLTVGLAAPIRWNTQATLLLAAKDNIHFEKGHYINATDSGNIVVNAGFDGSNKDAIIKFSDEMPKKTIGAVKRLNVSEMLLDAKVEPSALGDGFEVMENSIETDYHLVELDSSDDEFEVLEKDEALQLESEAAITDNVSYEFVERPLTPSSEADSSELLKQSLQSLISGMDDAYQPATIDNDMLSIGSADSLAYSIDSERSLAFSIDLAKPYYDQLRKPEPQMLIKARDANTIKNISFVKAPVFSVATAIGSPTLPAPNRIAPAVPAPVLANIQLPIAGQASAPVIMANGVNSIKPDVSFLQHHVHRHQPSTNTISLVNKMLFDHILMQHIERSIAAHLQQINSVSHEQIVVEQEGL